MATPRNPAGRSALQMLQSETTSEAWACLQIPRQKIPSSDITLNLHCTRQSHQRKLQGRDWIPRLRRSVLLSLVPSHSALCPAMPRRLLASAWGSRSLETRVSPLLCGVRAGASYWVCSPPGAPGSRQAFFLWPCRQSGKCPAPDPLCSSHSSSPFKTPESVPSVS